MHLIALDCLLTGNQGTLVRRRAPVQVYITSLLILFQLLPNVVQLLKRVVSIALVSGLRGYSLEGVM